MLLLPSLKHHIPPLQCKKKYKNDQKNDDMNCRQPTLITLWYSPLINVWRVYEYCQSWVINEWRVSVSCQWWAINVWRVSESCQSWVINEWRVSLSCQWCQSYQCMESISVLSVVSELSMYGEYLCLVRRELSMNGEYLSIVSCELSMYGEYMSIVSHELSMNGEYLCLVSGVRVINVWRVYECCQSWVTGTPHQLAWVVCRSYLYINQVTLWFATWSIVFRYFLLILIQMARN
jgi:hypothetical protein